MARYRKIDPRIWNDEKFRTLTDDGKLAFLFTLTHPGMTALGAMRAALPGLAGELGWTLKRFERAFVESVKAGMVNVDRAASYIEAPNFLRYNEPEGPNSITGAWLAALDLIPECELRRSLLERCRRYLDAKSEAYRSAIKAEVWRAFPSGNHGADASDMDPPYPSPDPCGIQEQEQEQEEEDLARDGTTPSFASLWSIYPTRNGRKERKADAEKEWHKLTPQDRAAAIADIADRLEHDRKWREGFFPEAHRYLRRRSWSDDEKASEPDRAYTPA
jgi:hypothetical protein